MPILGVIASSISGNLYSASYESIATVNGTGSSATIEFSSIPQTYTHLQVRAIIKLTGNTSNYYNQPFYLGTGGSVDTGTNYARHGIRGVGTSTLVSAASATSAYVYDCAPAYSTGIVGTTILDILDYTNTNKYKVIRGSAGVDTNGSGGINFDSSLWLNTGAVTNIRFTADINNYDSVTSFALYGIKVA